MAAMADDPMSMDSLSLNDLRVLRTFDATTGDSSENKPKFGRPQLVHDSLIVPSTTLKAAPQEAARADKSVLEAVPPEEFYRLHVYQVDESGLAPRLELPFKRRITCSVVVTPELHVFAAGPVHCAFSPPKGFGSGECTAEAWKTGHQTKFFKWHLTAISALHVIQGRSLASADPDGNIYVCDLSHVETESRAPRTLLAWNAGPRNEIVQMREVPGSPRVISASTAQGRVLLFDLRQRRVIGANPPPKKHCELVGHSHCNATSTVVAHQDGTLQIYDMRMMLPRKTQREPGFDTLTQIETYQDRIVVFGKGIRVFSAFDFAEKALSEPVLSLGPAFEHSWRGTLFESWILAATGDGFVKMLNLPTDLPTDKEPNTTPLEEKEAAAPPQEEETPPPPPAPLISSPSSLASSLEELGTI